MWAVPHSTRSRLFLHVPLIFFPSRVGLDHLSLSVGSVDDLHSAAGRLAAAGVEHGEVKDLGSLGMTILSVQDPDDINVELSAPNG